jgi:hypothetical protein
MTTTLLFFLIIIVIAVVVIVLAVFIFNKVNKAAEEHGTTLEQIEDSLSRIQDMIQDSGDAAKPDGLRAPSQVNDGIAQTQFKEHAAEAGAAVQEETAAGMSRRAWAGAASEQAEVRRTETISALAAETAEEEIEPIWDSGKTVTEFRVSDKKDSGHERSAGRKEPEIKAAVPAKAEADEEKAAAAVFPKFRDRDDGTDKFGRVYTLEELRTQIQ